jgi:hypothetical protein
MVSRESDSRHTWSRDTYAKHTGRNDGRAVSSGGMGHGVGQPRWERVSSMDDVALQSARPAVLTRVARSLAAAFGGAVTAVAVFLYS